MDINEQPIVIQEAIRMTQDAGEFPITEELAVEDSQRACGARLEEITNAAAIMTFAHGMDPKTAIGLAHMKVIRTSIILGARTAQRLNGRDVL